MTRGQRVPLMPWATRMIQWRVQWVAKSRDGANPIKTRPSSDWSLQLDSMKPESLVNANQLRCVEYVLESCTRVAVRSFVPNPYAIGSRHAQCLEAKSQVVLREETTEG